MATATMVKETAQMPCMDADRTVFRQKFDREAFEFKHNLAQHPLFTLDRLIELARETQQQRPDDLFYDAGTSDLNTRWADAKKPEFSAAEAVQRIENCGAWIVLKRADKQPEYRALLDRCMAELQDLSGLNLNRIMKMQEVIMFVTSPKRITTYHIDRECSLLMQIRGEKEISIFNRNDRDVLSEEEIERFWTVDHNAPRYKPELQSHATVYTLRPGTGIHIPVNFPHWLQNGNDISISLNVNFQYRDTERANLYRMNHLLRKAGLRPTPPGKSPAMDSFKKVAILPAVWTKNVLRGRKPWA
ncbi:MAG TPA: cupin-like domain-containing protein [Dongiaceae bacterium]|nr:cupin-like domain-containing protein [Dongiaceae bacterium]